MPRQIEPFAKPIHAAHSNYGYDDPVIADLIRNPEVKGGTYNNTNQPHYPLSLDGRGIKGEGENKTAPSTCHSEQSEESKQPDPSYWLQGSIHGTGQQQYKPTAIPSLLTRPLQNSMEHQ